MLLPAEDVWQVPAGAYVLLHAAGSDADLSYEPVAIFEADFAAEHH